MIKIASALGAVSVALLLSACGGGSAQDKMMAACMGMNKDANAQANCTCMVGKLKEKLSDDEMSSLADALNDITARANGNQEAAGQEIGMKVMSGQLVNSKVGGEFLAASKACSAPANGGVPGTTPTPAPMPMPTPAPAPAPADASAPMDVPAPAPSDTPMPSAPSDGDNSMTTPSP